MGVVNDIDGRGLEFVGVVLGVGERDIEFVGGVCGVDGRGCLKLRVFG